MNRKMKRMALPIGAALILGSSGFAYMATNTVPQTFAGDGNGDIAGYTVSNVTYFENNQDQIARVRFGLDEVARVATAYITNADGSQTAYKCTRGTNQLGWDCVPKNDPTTFGAAENLRVIAYQ